LNSGNEWQRVPFEHTANRSVVKE